MKKLIVPFLLLFLTAACSESTDEPDPNAGNNNGNNTGGGTLGKGQPGSVGIAGIEAWDKLASSEKDRIKNWNALFLHQSVGQDLEEGAKANGFPFDYYGPNDKTEGGLRGGIFVDVGGIANGNPSEKIRVFRENATRNKDLLQIAIFKFGYADIMDDNFEKVKTE